MVDTAIFSSSDISGAGGLLANELNAYRSFIDPHLPPYNAKGDAMHGRDGTTDGTNRLFVPNYVFTAADIGKTIWADVFGPAARTITAIGGAGDPNACTVSGGALTAGGARAYVFGTDDTAALQAALDAARFSAMGVFVGDNTANLRAEVRGRVVMLRGGRSYLVSNSAASYNSGNGKTAALYMSRRTGLWGPDAFDASEIIMAPNSYGDVISNTDARKALANNTTATSYVDFLSIGNLRINGCRGITGSANQRSGLLIYPSYNGYLDTDPCNYVTNVWSHQNVEHGFYFGGRGELMASKLRGPDNQYYGLYLNGLVDSTIEQSSFGGNRRTGVRVNRSANNRLVDIKSWYSGGTLSLADEKDNANFVFEADQALNGKCICIGLDSQESRGSGFVFDNSGHNILKACRAQDPGQLIANTVARPTVCAGVALRGVGTTENDLDIRVESAVRAFVTVNFAGTSAVDVDANAFGNYGSIRTQGNLQYTGRTSITSNGSPVADGSKLSGAGISNGKNTQVLVDAVALT